jgi:RNA polymerase sigma-70 factor (ECF subfamily)
VKNSDLDFAAAVREFSGMCYSLAFRILGNQEDARDAVQQAFYKLYQNRKRFLKEKNLRNWIYTITLNTARDVYRRKKRQSEVVLTEALHLAERGSADARIGNSLLTQKLVATLPYELKEVVVLYYLEERTVNEIAEVVSISESLVKVRLHRARKKLLEEFEKDIP